jgi:hypothetical protein
MKKRKLIMNRKMVFTILTGLLLLLFISSCPVPAMKSEAATAAGTIDDVSGRAIAQHPAVYETKVGDISQSLVWTGSNYGVAWYTVKGDVCFARINKNGIKIGSDVVIDSNQSLSPSLAWCSSKSQFGVAWHNGPDQTLYFLRLDSNGKKIEGSKRIISSYGEEPSLVCGGNYYCLAWMEKLDDLWVICFRILDSNGNKVSDERLGSEYYRNSFNPCLAYNPFMDEFGLAFYSWNSSHTLFEIYFNRIIKQNGSWKKAICFFDPSVRISNDNDANSERPSLTYNKSDNGYGVAWADYRKGYWAIYFSRIDKDGNEIPNTEKRISNDIYTPSFPSLAWNDNRNEFGIAYADRSHMFFGRIQTDGTVTKKAIGVMYIAEPSLVLTDSNYALAYQEYFGDGGFIRLDEDGNMIPIGGLTGTLTGTQDGYYYIHHKESGRYLTSNLYEDDFYAVGYSSSNVDKQKWKLRDGNNNGVFAIINKASGKYIKSKNIPDDTVLFLSDSEDKYGWKLLDGNGNGIYTLCNAYGDNNYRIYLNDKNVNVNCTNQILVDIKTGERTYWEIIPAFE